MPHCVHPSIHPSIHPMQAAVGESPHLPPPRGHLQSRSVDVAIAITDALHYDIVSKKRVHPKTTAASCRDPRLSQVIYISIYTNRPTERASGSWARRARTTQTHLPVVYIHISTGSNGAVVGRPNLAVTAQPGRSRLGMVGDALVLTEPLIACGVVYAACCGNHLRSPFWAQERTITHQSVATCGV